MTGRLKIERHFSDIMTWVFISLFALKDSLWCQIENQVVQAFRLKGAWVWAIKSIEFVHIIQFARWLWWSWYEHCLVFGLSWIFLLLQCLTLALMSPVLCLKRSFILPLRILRCVRTFLRTGNHKTSSLTFLALISVWWRLSLGREPQLKPVVIQTDSCD